MSIKKPVQVVQVPGSFKVPFHIKDADGKLLAQIFGDQMDPAGTSIAEARKIAEEIATSVNERADVIFYVNCEKHIGMPFTMKARGTASLETKTVCPICNPPSSTHAERK